MTACTCAAWMKHISIDNFAIFLWNGKTTLYTQPHKPITIPLYYLPAFVIF